MKKLGVYLIVVVVLLSGTGLAQGAVVSSYWRRMEAGFPNQVTVYGLLKEYQYPYAEVKVQIPQLIGALDQQWQAQFNTELATKIEAFAQEIMDLGAEVYAEYGDGVVMPYSAFVDYEVKTNHGGLLSLAITAYSFTGGAHGMTHIDYINLDLTTGHTISFADLFPTDDELSRVASIISEKIAQEPDAFFIDQFTPGLFEPDQGFYLQGDQVIVCFGLYELAPYVAGIQEFAVAAP